MKQGEIREGMDLYMAAATKNWRLRGGWGTWGRAHVLRVIDGGRQVHVEFHPWTWSDTTLQFMETDRNHTQWARPHAFRGEWSTVLAETEADARLARLDARDRELARVTQQRADEAVARRGLALGLTVTSGGARYGQLNISTVDMERVCTFLENHGGGLWA